MKPNTKKPITMTTAVATNTCFTYIFIVLTAIILVYECFHIRQGSIIKVVGFIVVTVLFYIYTKIIKSKMKENDEEKEECKREAFYTQRMQERKVTHHILILLGTILILLIIFSISSVISSSSRRPSWEYKSDKRTWEKELYGLEALPDTIPKGAKEITYYCAEFPNIPFSIIFRTILPNFYIRYTLNDKDYEQAKKEIKKEGTLEKLVSYYQGVFHLEPEDIKQNYKDYQTYLFYEDDEHNTSGVMINDNKRELCYFYAKYNIVETSMLDLEQ